MTDCWILEMPGAFKDKVLLKRPSDGFARFAQHGLDTSTVITRRVQCIQALGRRLISQVHGSHHAVEQLRPPLMCRHTERIDSVDLE